MGKTRRSLFGEEAALSGYNQIHFRIISFIPQFLYSAIEENDSLQSTLQLLGVLPIIDSIAGKV